MANYATLKAAIADVIKQNGNNEITGALLQQSLFAMIASLGNGYQFVGVADQTTDPGTPDQKIFYLAGPGTYPNFDSAIVQTDTLGVLYYDSAWHLSTINLPKSVSLQTNIVGGYDLLSGSEILGNIMNQVEQYSVGMPDNGYIRSSDGTTTTSSAWRHSKKIPVKEGEQFFVFARISDSSLLKVAYYDNSGAYLTNSPTVGSDASNTMKYFPFTIPSGVSYIMVHSAYDVDTDEKEPYLLFKEKIVDLLLNQQNIPSSNIDFPNSGYIDVDGVIKGLTSPAWKNSDLISVLPGVSYKTNLYGTVGVNCAVAFYDSEKTFMPSVSRIATVADFNQYDGVVPVGAYYMRVCTHESTISQSYCKLWGPNQFDELKGGYIQKYHNNLQKPYLFNGKTITFFGDSITKGVASDNGSLVTITDCYAKLLADKLGATINNQAISGSRFVGDGGGTPPAESITSVITSFSGSTDIIWIAGGTNDYQLQSPIGTPADTTEISMYGALYLVCEYLKTNYPNATIIFATPINWSRAVINHPIAIEKYRDVIFEMATKYGYSVVDCSEIGFPYEQTEDGTPEYKAAMIYDGVHPTTLGHRVMANNLASKVI